MSGNPYSVISIRGNPDKVRGMISQIKLITRQMGRRDGDILEEALDQYLTRVKQDYANVRSSYK